MDTEDVGLATTGLSVAYEVEHFIFAAAELQTLALSLAALSCVVFAWALRH